MTETTRIRVAVIGCGVTGKRVAEAVAAQHDRARTGHRHLGTPEEDGQPVNRLPLLETKRQLL